MIDFTTCTMNEVLARSAVCHPSVFTDGLKATAKIHALYADTTHDMRASRVARGMAQGLNTMARDVEYDRFYPANCTLGERVMAFKVACDLQGVPSSCRSDIAARG